ncbi:methyltransferase domain-containing protein [Xanthomonas sp. AmX2]|uniref:class I SAM-dependent methyltransferase n=1 Tax=Xanthomonas sp. TaxID=29446 RepID=UPI00197CEAAF|nr:class I SAM-dependent methyltransferase [Xanthomonas sp.]MBN6150218.1 methyltransferase domain-containing protein [Xanthomonas sp.]
MSGFSAAWLDLREPADRAARDPALLQAVAGHLHHRSRVTVLDLGCGSGASVRALAPSLPATQRWRLLDHDPALLALACTRIGDAVPVQAHAQDLRALDALPLDSADLVTASALFDLAGHDWIDALAARLQQAGAALYAALNYDGTMQWTPALDDDAAVLAAFNAHQRRDKGLGQALGPDAARELARRLAARGFQVRSAPSPWRLRPDQAELHRALLRGIAEAVRETGQLPDHALQAWLAQRLALADRAECVVGHVDLFAWR